VQYCAAVYENYLVSYDTTTRHDLIARMVNERHSLKEKGQSLPRHITDTGIIEELTNLVFAGTDTTGNTLTYLFYELSRHPEWQLRLRDEVNSALGDQADFMYDKISELPVLEAVAQEILRLRPAAPSGLQRLTPSSGAVIDEVAVPPNVRRPSKCVRQNMTPVSNHLRVGYCFVPGIDFSARPQHLSGARSL
jgi:cytochrome P450